MMTILNVYLSNNEKTHLKKVVETNEIKSMSEFVRNVIKDQLLVESEKRIVHSPDFIIPDYIPQNKYVLFTSNKSIAAVGDNPSQVAQIAAKMGVIPPFTIKFNGKNPPKPKNFIYSLNIGKAWHYADFLDQSYPIVDISLRAGEIYEKLFASVDTAASICIIKEGFIDSIKYEKVGNPIEISTAGGVIKKQVYQADVLIVDQTFNIKFVEAPIDESLPFNFLIGRNLLDQLDAFFFGLKQILLLKIAQN